MKITRILVSIILIFGIMSTSPAASAASTDEIVTQMLSYYQHYQEDGWADIQRLLQQLEKVDAEEALQWRELMESWSRANTEIDFNAGTLPDGLPQDNSLCIVVFGYQLGAGGKMQNELVCRLKIALAAAEQYPNAYILVTGGATGSGSNATEAGRMADWLVQKGISSNRIIQETQSYSTEQNAINGLKILKSSYPQVKHLALVTSDYHMIRAHLVFAARQAAVGGDIIDIVAHACYDTINSTAMDYSVQTELIGMMLGLKVKDSDKPTLSKVTGLTLSGNATVEEGQLLGLTATAEYNTGFSRDVTADTVFAGYDPNTPGTQIIEASFTENGITVTDVTGVEVISGPTEPPTETAAPLAAKAEMSPETADTESETGAFKWLVGIAVVLVIALVVILYQMWQEHQRRQRRKRRRRKKMQWE